MPTKEVASTTTIQPSDLITPEELCARLKVKSTWPYEQMRQRPHAKNPIPVIKMGRLLRFSWTAVSAWLAAQQLPAGKKVRA